MLQRRACVVPRSSVCGVGRAVLGLWLAGMIGVGLAHAQTATAPAPATPTAPAPKPAPAPSPEQQAPAQAPTKGVIRHGITEAPAQPAGTIRVACYNIENLYAPGADAKAGEEGRTTEPKPVSHQEAAAKALRSVNADVVALQEIESLATLTAFRDTYLKDMGYEHIVSLDAGDERGIEQAVLSRLPVVATKQWVRLPLGGTHNTDRTETDRVAGGPIMFKRSPLMVSVELPKPKGAAADTKPGTLSLFVVHFKSGGKKDNYWREREASKTAALAREVAQADPSGAVMILGDFNARPQDKAFKSVLSQGFTDAFGDLPDADPKYITHASDRVIDHVMLDARAMAGLVKETRFVFGTMQRPAGVDWRTTAAPEGYASDHYPVVIDLDIAKLAAFVPVPTQAPAPAESPKP